VVADQGAVAVLLVDDQTPFRMAARAVVRRAPGFEVVGEATSGEEAIALVSELRPRLVLMDVNMPGVNGVEATRRMMEAQPSTVVFLCSTVEISELPNGGLASGARAYFNKEDFSAEQLRGLWDTHGDVDT
jgi:DNA-binding NarL/FixJ family response regulator